MQHEDYMIDWYRGFKGDKKHLPRSQGQSWIMFQKFHAPIMAAIALISGKRAGDLSSLREFLGSKKMICEVCGGLLDRTGKGHNDNCDLQREAVEVLSSDN